MNETREDLGYKRGMPPVKIPARKIRIRYLVGPGAQESDALYTVQDTPEIKELIRRRCAEEVG